VATNRWAQGGSHAQKVIASILWPVQYTVDLPANLIEQTQSFFRERLELLTENSKLQQEHMYLQAQVQKLRSLESENQELKTLLRSVGQEREFYFEGRVIHADIDPFTQQVLLNKGQDHGVTAGQPVIDARGLVGIVVAPNASTSQVLLLTDPGFAVPVQSVRSGERAIATGSGPGGELRLNYVPRTADFIEGDQLVTSGLGGKFPAGYPVGTISSIQHDPSDRFTVIGVTPNARLGHLRHVLFIKHHNTVLANGYPAKYNIPDSDAPELAGNGPKPAGSPKMLDFFQKILAEDQTKAPKNEDHPNLTEPAQVAEAESSEAMPAESKKMAASSPENAPKTENIKTSSQQDNGVSKKMAAESKKIVSESPRKAEHRHLPPPRRDFYGRERGERPTRNNRGFRERNYNDNDYEDDY
jgi:rod shape-determining protein MreC